ncbi:MAG: glutathione peroxidase [Elusimicrobia bacterium]|nr:MAG: glutathione peroxidase [Elusimicrobiota bacterium]KAF0152503.1 MAG: glutathione peroxidase [Elusimicrobiota bacterium]
MTRYVVLFCVLAAAVCQAGAAAEPATAKESPRKAGPGVKIKEGKVTEKTVYDFTVRDARGADHPLSGLKGKVALVVNVASNCGFTPQYEGLEELHKKYGKLGLEVIGFPCNQFGGQEPGTNEQIQKFCSLNYGVTFPVMGKVEVNGKGSDLLYVHLKEKAPGVLGSEAIKWNFTKFLVGRDGRVISRYAPQVKPAALAPDIEKALDMPVE